jgi:hypothetical protein
MTSILLFGLLAAAANVVGGLVLIKSGAHRLGERFLKYLVALGAGSRPYLSRFFPRPSTSGPEVHKTNPRLKRLSEQ